MGSLFFGLNQWIVYFLGFAYKMAPNPFLGLSCLPLLLIHAMWCVEESMDLIRVKLKCDVCYLALRPEAVISATEAPKELANFARLQ